jgi:hypothetical protein
MFFDKIVGAEMFCLNPFLSDRIVYGDILLLLFSKIFLNLFDYLFAPKLESLNLEKNWFVLS